MTDSQFDRLSPRQRDCLRLAYAHLTSKEIARELGLRAGTVDGYLSEGVAILGARNRRAAAVMLHDHEAPLNLGERFAGVSDTPPDAAPTAPTSRPATFWGPLDPRNREADNALSVTGRLGWIIVVAAVVAVGFGAIASGLRTVSDLVGSLARLGSG